MSLTIIRPAAAVLGLVLIGFPSTAAAQRPGEFVVPAYRSWPAPESFVVDSVANGGVRVHLSDATIWEVRLPYAPVASGWSVGDAVVIRAIPAPTGDHDFLLVNASDNSRAEARFAGRRPT